MKIVLVALALIYCAGCAAKKVEPEISSTLTLKHAHFVLPSVQLDGSEIPMYGKWTEKYVQFDDKLEDHWIWIKNFSTSVIDDETGKKNEDFLCHSHLGLDGKESYKTRRFFGNHGGSSSTMLPDGFAVAVKVSKAKPVYLFGMAADYAHRGLKKKVHFEIDVDYYDQDTATKLGVKNLDIRFVFGKFDSGGGLHELHEQMVHSNHEAEANSVEYDSRADHIHWMVKPGKHEYRTIINDQLFGNRKSELKLHHVHVHMHPYAESAELFDLTENKSLFFSKAETFADRTVLKKIEPFSSKDGILLSPSHQYEIVGRYNNTTSKSVGGMVVFRMLYRTLESTERP